MAPGYFHRKIEEKIEPKEISSCLIPRLLVVFTRQLKILVTALNELGASASNLSAFVFVFVVAIIIVVVVFLISGMNFFISRLL